MNETLEKPNMQIEVKDQYDAQKEISVLYAALSWHYKAVFPINPIWFMVYLRVPEERTLFWSNDSGWVSFESADIFTPNERENFNLPVSPSDESTVDWLMYEECRKLTIQERLDGGDYPPETNTFGGVLTRTFALWRNMFDMWYLTQSAMKLHGYHFFLLCDNYYHCCYYDPYRLVILSYTEGDIVEVKHKDPQKYLEDLKDTYKWHEGIESYDVEPIDWDEVKSIVHSNNR